MKVLLAEDSGEVRQALATILGHWQMQTVEAANGQEAWELLNSEQIDLLISDWMLPEMTGTELAERIRDSPDHCGLPILMISGQAQHPDVVDAAEMGIDGYLAKPFTFKQLKEKLRSTLERTKRRLLRRKIAVVQEGHLAFDKTSNDPLVLIAEPAIDPDQLQSPRQVCKVEYLHRVARAIDRVNAENEGLNLGYRIETNTRELTKHLNSSRTRERTRLVLLSSECHGNSILLARLINVNHSGVSAYLLSDSPESIPLNHRAGLEEAGVGVWGHSEMDSQRLHEIIRSHALTHGDEVASTSTPLEIRKRLANDLESMEELPMLPQVSRQIMALSREPESGMDDWARAIAVDPLSCAAVLRRVRSSAFGIQTAVDDVDRAVLLLGKSALLDLTASEGVRRAFTGMMDGGFPLDDFCAHGLATGFAARLLSFPLDEAAWSESDRKEFERFALGEEALSVLREIDLPGRLGLEAGDDPFMAGMLHDIGKAAMASAYPGLFNLLIEEFENSGWSRASADVEDRVTGGLNHMVVGEIVGRKWEIGDRLCEVVRNHHDASAASPLAFLVGLADLLGKARFPFPLPSAFPVARALQEDDLERIPSFLPDGFFDRPLITPRELCKLARVLAPVIERLTEEMKSSLS